MSFSQSFQADTKEQALEKLSARAGASGTVPQPVQDYMRQGIEAAKTFPIDVSAYGHAYDGASIEETTCTVRVAPLKT